MKVTLREKWLEKLLTYLRSQPTTIDLFNLWRSTDPTLERKNSPKNRCENCAKYFSYWLENQPRIFLIGEAPGYAGSRFTGISFTSERIILDGRLPEPLRKLNLCPTSLRKEGYSEQSASLIWGELQKVDLPIALWMTVPWHPHKPLLPLTNRKPRAKEIEVGSVILAMIVDAFPKTQFCAVGRTAHSALQKLGKSVEYLRHPAQGGAGEFREGFKRFVKNLLR